jgi:hypothetical protein
MKHLLFFGIFSLAIFSCSNLLGWDSSGLKSNEQNPDSVGADIISVLELYLSPKGNDSWSGRYPEPLKNGMDGPLKTINRALEIVHYLKGEEFKELSFRTRQLMPRYLTRPGTEGYGGLPDHIVFWLRGGDYYIDKTIDIHLAHSYPITFAAYEDEEPLLTGGVRIKNWEITKVNGITAWVASVPEVFEDYRNLTQLFVNNQRAQRCRIPKTGFFVVEDPLLPKNERINYHFHPQNQFISAAGDIKAWKGIQNGEIVVFHYWVEQRLPLASFDPTTRMVTTKKMTSKPFLAAHPAHEAGNARYYIENVFETLTDPGEWFLDRSGGKLYYIPREGEKPEESYAVVPKTNTLINIQGDPEHGKFIENIRFQGISFKYNAFEVDRHGDYTYFPLIKMNGVKNSSFEDCKYSHLGGYAIYMQKGCQGIRITGNNFYDMAGGAIFAHGASWGENPNERTMLNRITDNTIKSGNRHSTELTEAIHVDHFFRSVISHNRIHDFYWSAIAIRSYKPCPLHLLVENNEIFNIGQGIKSDLGGIHLWARVSGVVIRGNRIYDINSAEYGGNGIYLDDMAEQVIIENNLVYNTDTDLVCVKGTENVFRNNIFVFGGHGCIKRAVDDPDEALPYVANIMNNILVTRGEASIFRSNYGMDILAPVIRSDLNLIWNTTGNNYTCEQQASGGNLKVTLDEWMRVTGNDLNSIITDPMFEDIGSFDFRLKESSPAYKLGFRPVDFSNVGPRSKGDRPVFKNFDILKKKDIEFTD